jgi:hypothetical protein
MICPNSHCRGIVAKQFPRPASCLKISVLLNNTYIMIISYDSGDHFHQDCFIKYYAPILSCRAVEYVPTNSSDISFQDLFVRNCLSYNSKWTSLDMIKWCIYSKSRIRMLQTDTIAKHFWWELAEIWTWKQYNNGRLTVLNAPAIWNVFQPHCFMHDFWWYFKVCRGVLM